MALRPMIQGKCHIADASPKIVIKPVICSHSKTAEISSCWFSVVLLCDGTGTFVTVTWQLLAWTIGKVRLSGSFSQIRRKSEDQIWIFPLLVRASLEFLLEPRSSNHFAKPRANRLPLPKKNLGTKVGTANYFAERQKSSWVRLFFFLSVGASHLTNSGTVEHHPLPLDWIVELTQISTPLS